MLQAHSPLWHYLWVAPNVLALLLAAALVRRGLHKQYPFFVTYLGFASLKELCLYALDLSPRISGNFWWGTFWVGTIIEGLLKFLLVAELLQHLLRPWPSVSKLGRNIVSWAGVFFVLVAAASAAFAAPDNAPWFIGGAHILYETLYLTLAGLIISIFLFAASFKIPWMRNTFGIALGFGLVWCEQLALWALLAGGLIRNQTWFDFPNMATYHFSVIIWFYYLLAPQEALTPEEQRVRFSGFSRQNNAIALSSNSPKDHEETLSNWNRELERLIHQ